MTALLISVICLGVSAQTGVTVSGTVTDESGEPLIGATVRLEGSKTAVVTDLEGQFRITAPADGVLMFSYVGYADKKEKIGGRSVVDVVMSSNVKELDQVVVIGYGTQKKADLTGSVAVVDMNEARKQPATDIASMLQGQVSGVSVATSSQPGNIASIRIRGVGSFSSVGPLYVIDGMIVNDANNLNPNEIENMQVLKDASASAIYGARGANGVILITTKKGKVGKPNSAEAYSKIILSPNPADGIVEIEGFEPRQITLVDMSGRMVAFKAGSYGSPLCSFDVSTLSPGQYIVCMTDGYGRKATARLIRK